MKKSRVLSILVTVSVILSMALFTNAHTTSDWTRLRGYGASNVGGSWADDVGASGINIAGYGAVLYGGIAYLDQKPIKMDSATEVSVTFTVNAMNLVGGNFNIALLDKPEFFGSSTETSNGLCVYLKSGSAFASYQLYGATVLNKIRADVPSVAKNMTGSPIGATVKITMKKFAANTWQILINDVAISTKITVSDSYFTSGKGFLSVGVNTGATYTMDVTVKALSMPRYYNVTGVAMADNKTTAKVRVGDEDTLTAVVSPGNATDPSLTWTSSNNAIATVANGVVTAHRAGTATITARATAVNGNFSAACTYTFSLLDLGTFTVSTNQTTVISKINPGTSIANFIITTNPSSPTYANIVFKDSSGIAIDNANYAVTNLGSDTTMSVTEISSDVTTEYSMLILGDVSGDGLIDIADLYSTKQKLLGSVVLTGQKLIAADIYMDGVVSVSDLLAIKMHLLNISIISQ